MHHEGIKRVNATGHTKMLSLVDLSCRKIRIKSKQFCWSARPARPQHVLYPLLLLVFLTAFEVVLMALNYCKI